MKYKLKDVLNRYIRGPFGSALKRSEMKSYGIPVYEQQNAIYDHREFRFFIDDDKFNELKRFQVQTGDLIISCSGTVGKVSIISKDDSKGIISQALLILRPNTDIILPDYLYYFFKSYYGYKSLISRSSGSVQINLAKREIIEDIDIFVPVKSIQEKIVRILKNIDNKIKVNNEINNNLYEFTNKLFEEKILNNQDKEHWTEYVLSDISKMINGYSYKGNELTDKSDIGMATIKNFERTGGFKLDGFKDIIPEKAKDDHYVKPYEVLVACTDLTQNADIIGNAIMLLNTSDYNEIIMSMDLVKLVPITDFINNYMLYAIVNSKNFKDFALGYKSGTTVLHLNKNCFKEYTIKLPNEDILKDLSKVIEVNYKKISQIIEENKKLEQLRDSLLPKLMNGEIDLDNIEI